MLRLFLNLDCDKHPSFDTQSTADASAPSNSTDFGHSSEFALNEASSASSAHDQHFIKCHYPESETLLESDIGTTNVSWNSDGYWVLISFDMSQSSVSMTPPLDTGNPFESDVVDITDNCRCTDCEARYEAEDDCNEFGSLIREYQLVRSYYSLRRNRLPFY